MGLDSRALTPELTGAVVVLASEVRSFERAAVVIRRVLGQSISTSTIRRVAGEVGLELAEETWGDAEQEVAVPQVAVVSCDGGRIRTREPSRGRGVHPSGENGWRETKNASLERMIPPENEAGVDPCPDVPTTFKTAARVAKITEKPVPNGHAPPDGTFRRSYPFSISFTRSIMFSTRPWPWPMTKRKAGRSMFGTSRSAGKAVSMR